MTTAVEFDINEALKLYLSDPTTIATPEADNVLQECESDPESLTPALINSVLNPIIEAIAASPESILQQSSFDSIRLLLKYANLHPGSSGYSRKNRNRVALLIFCATDSPPSYLQILSANFSMSLFRGFRPRPMLCKAILKATNRMLYNTTRFC